MKYKDAFRELTEKELKELKKTDAIWLMKPQPWGEPAIYQVCFHGELYPQEFTGTECAEAFLLGLKLGYDLAAGDFPE